MNDVMMRGRLYRTNGKPGPFFTVVCDPLGSMGLSVRVYLHSREPLNRDEYIEMVDMPLNEIGPWLENRIDY